MVVIQFPSLWQNVWYSWFHGWQKCLTSCNNSGGDPACCHYKNVSYSGKILRICSLSNILNLANQQNQKDNLWFYWLLRRALLPTWGSPWFVSGMAELLSGRRAYVTGASDSTWVQSWGLGEWPRSQRETEVTTAHCISALWSKNGSNHDSGSKTQIW